MRTTKKITSIVLAVLMVVSMMSVMAVTASATTNVAKVGGTEYETLQAALDAAQDNDTVELLTDITLEPQTISGESAKYGAYITKSITFDGKGHTISSNAPRAIGVKGSGSKVNVTFKDVTVKINNNPSNAICICTRGGIGELTLDNVTLDTQGCNKAYNQPLTIGGTQYDQAKVTVKNGSVIQTNNEASKYYAIILWNPVDLTIQDSTIKGWACVYQKPFEAGTTDTTEVKIDNSTLISKGLAGSTNHFAAIMTEEEGFSCEVTNSNIKVTAAENTYQGVVASNGSADGFKVELGEGNNVSMTGDTAIIGYNFDETNHEISVSGGSFNKPVDEEYLSNTVDTHDNGDGTYTVSNSGKTYVARVGSQGYETLQAAIDAAPAGATVKLVADITDTSIKYAGDPRFAYFVTGKSEITIDGNGHTVDVGGRGFGVAGDGVGADITFKNITINNSTSNGRAIDTRGNKISTFTLDKVTLNCTSTSGNPQALTIGGSQETPVDVNIINGSNIKSSTSGYGIITFNPVNMTIDNSTIEAWGCLYYKAPSSSHGSRGSVTNVTNSHLISKNINSGNSNDFSVIAIEDKEITLNITNTDIDIDAQSNTQAIVGYRYDGSVLTNENITLGAGNEVTFTGQPEYASYVNDKADDGVGLEVTGGTFSEPIPVKYCADGKVCVTTNTAGEYTVGNDDNPLNSFVSPFASINDGNKFGLPNTTDYLAGTLLGVQKKTKVRENGGVDADYTSEGNQEGVNNMRFVAVLDRTLLQGADDYGFILAKVKDNSTKIFDYTNTNINHLTVNSLNGEKKISAQGTYNNVCGDEAYGDPTDNTTDYKYITCAVNDVEDDYKIIARFYYTKGGKTYYAKYAGQSYNYTGCIADWLQLS